MSSTPARAAQSRESGQSKSLLLVLICLIQIMVVIDLSIVAVALPRIGQDLRFSLEGLQWVVTGYALVYGGFLLLGGRAVDVFGQRRLLLAGLILFGLASMLAGFAVTAWMLVVGRVAQGLSAAALTPATLALVTSQFPEGAARERALGSYAAMSAVGFTVGSVSSGLLTELLSWRWVFFINGPMVLVALLLIPLVVPPDQVSNAPAQLDLPGTITVTLGLAALIYALTAAGERGWTSLATGGLIALGLVLLAAFVLIERRASAPLLPLSFFQRRIVTVANLASMLKSTVGIADILIPTLYFQQVLRYSPLQSGLSFIPMGLMAIVAGWAAGRLVGRLRGVKPVILLGLAIEAVGLLLMTQMPLSGWWPLLLVGMMIEVAGYLTADVGLVVAANSGLPAHERGVGAGVLMTSQQVGAAWGTAIITSVIAARTSQSAGSTADASALISSLQAGLLVGILFALSAFVLVLVALRQESAGSGLGVNKRSSI